MSTSTPVDLSLQLDATGIAVESALLQIFKQALNFCFKLCRPCIATGIRSLMRMLDPLSTNEACMTVADIPDGFEPHVRPSPLTAPWEPIYYKKTPSAVILGVRLAEPHTNSRGLAHGGFITALADNAMGLSCGLKRSGSTHLLTAGLSIDFINSASIGQWIAIETDVIKVGGSLCFAQCIVTADGVRCARASGVFSVVRAKE